jgi:hypothetical protein
MSPPNDATTPSGLVTDAEVVRRWLDWPPDEIHRLRALDAPGEHRPFELPPPDEAAEILRNLDVPPAAAAEVVAAMPSRQRDPEAWWILERCYWAVVGRDETRRPPWPAPWVTDEAFTRYFHLYVFIAAVRDVLAMHAARGIPEDITWATLGDVGLQVAHHHARHDGVYGFDGAFWMFNHFRGDLFQIGRLQYELGAATFDGGVFTRGDPILHLHIPAIGPLTPESCDASQDEARAFFAKHFPETSYRFGICESWLLDEQLTEILPASSNIVSFQRRFTHDPDWSSPGDDDTIRFTFGRLPKDLGELPQDTTLQRGIVRMIREGKHWRIRRGWLEV